MTQPPRVDVSLEISVDHPEAVLSAARGGAHRLELCSALAEGGLTPGLGLVEWALAAVSIPIVCMVRPRPGGFCYSPAELDVMAREIAAFRSAGAHGVVLGVLTPDHRIDVPATRRLVEAARPMPVVFHRAFDLTGDLPTAIEHVIATGAHALLTSGGAATLEAGALRVQQLVAQAAGRIQLIGGAGVRPANAGRLWRELGLNALHTSLRRPWPQAAMPAEAHIGLHDDTVFTVLEADVRAVLREMSL